MVFLMKLRLFQSGDGPSSSEGGRVQQHVVEYALALGQGGSAAWSKEPVTANLDAIDGELAYIQIELERIFADEEPLVGLPEDDPRWDATDRRRQVLADRMLFHAWRRCTHTISRMRTVDPGQLTAAEVARLEATVAEIAALWPYCCPETECTLDASFIRKRFDVLGQVRELMQPSAGA
jgi:hypothetical protein